MFVSVVFLFLFSGCDKIKEYDGVDIKTLTFETVEYHGGYITTYIFDFINNNVRKSGFLPLPDETEERVFETIVTFTDEQEKAFIDYCYSYGLFDLNEHYETNEIIADGGGWTLTLEYIDGTSKTSTGDNARPIKYWNIFIY